MNRDLLNSIVILALIGAVFGGGTAFVSSQACERQWARSGLKSEWTLLGGCVVQRKDGMWVPANAIRDVSP